MHIHCIQHVPFENPGAIVKWSQQNGHELSITHLYAGEELPTINTWDMLVVMGGPMSVHDEKEFPWLAEEKSYIGKAIEQDKTVLGICLGSQLIAEALGAKVYRAKQKEIGWFPVNWTPNARNLLPNSPEQSSVFHWHGETYDLPAEAELLASSAVCQNQAFIYQGKVIGLQFHLEMLEENVNTIVDQCGHELEEAPYIQTKEEILRNSSSFNDTYALLSELLNGLQKQLY
ncbi:type 1 glutamine amidotransferase [Paenibacillus puldeungensis]|uniref:Type 1 glutamine amidotransferase n=1 Tax=Paenibacillus puldeungensis TaxID=696536 RepID=A0ABW3RZE4_9BACL